MFCAFFVVFMSNCIYMSEVQILLFLTRLLNTMDRDPLSQVTYKHTNIHTSRFAIRITNQVICINSQFTLMKITLMKNPSFSDRDHTAHNSGTKEPPPSVAIENDNKG